MYIADVIHDYVPNTIYYTNTNIQSCQYFTDILKRVFHFLNNILITICIEVEQAKSIIAQSVLHIADT